MHTTKHFRSKDTKLLFFTKKVHMYISSSKSNVLTVSRYKNQAVDKLF